MRQEVSPKGGDKRAIHLKGKLIICLCLLLPPSCPKQLSKKMKDRTCTNLTCERILIDCVPRVHTHALKKNTSCLKKSQF